MEILAIFIGLVIGLPAGIWVMHKNWGLTKDLWSIPIDKREDWLIEKKAKMFENYFVAKVLAKGGLVTIFIILMALWAAI